MMKKVIYILFILFLVSGLKAQDVHFSQFINMPLLTNPALTGNSQYMVRMGVNYRNQWKSILTDNPFVTQSAFTDVKIMPKRLKRDWIGVGAVFYNDKAGDGNLKTTEGYLLGSYTKSFNRTANFYGGIGFALGFANRSIEYTQLYFESQWIGYDFDLQKETHESFANNSFTYFDLNAGLFVKYFIPKKFEFHIGAGFNHVNRPNEKFSEDMLRMGFKTNIHAGFTIVINEQVYIKPDVMYSLISGADEFMAGSLFAYKVSENFIYLGCFTRSGRDIIPMAGLSISGVRLMISYDYNVSELEFASRNRGGLEVSLIGSFKLVGDRAGKFRKTASPKFSGY